MEQDIDLDIVMDSVLDSVCAIHAPLIMAGNLFLVGLECASLDPAKDSLRRLAEDVGCPRDG